MSSFTHKKPTHRCSNCGCNRHTPCYCMQKGTKPPESIRLLNSEIKKLMARSA